MDGTTKFFTIVMVLFLLLIGFGLWLSRSTTTITTHPDGTKDTIIVTRTITSS